MFGRRKKQKKPPTSIALDATAQYVGFWYRAGAAVVDLALIAALAVPVILVAAGGFEEAGPLHGVIVAAAALVYLLVSWWWKSRTLGLWLVSATIVDVRSGNQPAWWQWPLRFLGIAVSLLPAGIGLFWAGWNRRKRGWPDYLAKTAVVGDASFRPLKAEEKTNLADTIGSWSSPESH